MRSLVVDDSPLIRLLLRRFLSGYGDCDEAKGGGDALAAFSKNITTERPYDLVCLDLQMPDTDGIHVLTGIRQIEKTHNRTTPVKVVVVTAADDTTTVMQALESGADGYLIKPISREALASRLAVLFPDSHRSVFRSLET